MSPATEDAGEAGAQDAPPAPLELGDLGVLTSTDELRAKVRDATQTQRDRLAAPTDAPASTTSTLTSPLNEAYSSSRADEQRASCTSAIARTQPLLSPVPVLTATATWEGEPVIVHVFRPPASDRSVEASGETGDVIVVSRLDCSVVESVRG